MLTYQLLLEDDRYDDKLVVYVLAPSTQRARAMATEFLLRSAHHRMITVFLGREHQFTVGDRRARAAA